MNARAATSAPLDRSVPGRKLFEIVKPSQHAIDRIRDSLMHFMHLPSFLVNRARKGRNNFKLLDLVFLATTNLIILSTGSSSNFSVDASD